MCHLEGYAAAAVAGRHVHVDHERFGLRRQGNREVLRGQARQRAAAASCDSCARSRPTRRDAMPTSLFREEISSSAGGTGSCETPEIRLSFTPRHTESALLLIPVACNCLV